jgi:hypothetical protein
MVLAVTVCGEIISPGISTQSCVGKPIVAVEHLVSLENQTNRCLLSVDPLFTICFKIQSKQQVSKGTTATQEQQTTPTTTIQRASTAPCRHHAQGDSLIRCGDPLTLTIKGT